MPWSSFKLVVRGADSNELHTIHAVLPGDEGRHGPTAFRVLPDGKHAVTGGDHGDLVLWDLEEGMSVARWESSIHRNNIIAIAVSVEAKTVLTGSTDLGLQLWDLNTGKIVLDLTPQRRERKGKR